jgi:hypothetical protein
VAREQRKLATSVLQTAASQQTRRYKGKAYFSTRNMLPFCCGLKVALVPYLAGFVAVLRSIGPRRPVEDNGGSPAGPRGHAGPGTR